MKFQAPNCSDCTNRKNSLFGQCTFHELELLDLKKSAQLYKKSEVLFREGGISNGIYCLSSGKIILNKINAEGREQIIRIANPGDPIGYKSVLTSANYSCTAIALEDSIVCFVPKESFEKLLNNNPAIELKLINVLSNTLRDAEEKIASMSLKSVKERLAEALLLLNKMYNGENSNNYFSISREDLGSLVGTVKETAIRLLSQLKEEKIIATQGRKIKILDTNKLLRISHLHD